jgi:hypothetical protein
MLWKVIKYFKKEEMDTLRGHNCVKCVLLSWVTWGTGIMLRTSAQNNTLDEYTRYLSDVLSYPVLRYLY